MLRSFTLTTVTVLLSSLSFAQEGPPGLIKISGGKTKIGTDVKDLEPLIAKQKSVANTLAGETPEHTADVEDFYLMPNEVTNEQYAEFVSATGYQPPYYWGDAALDEGRQAFLEEEGRKIQEARKAGDKYDRQTWDPAEWWKDNWQGLEWKVPDDRLDAPVNYVSYNDAQAYCRWAGLRLMTEIEYQRAARGDSDHVYPWGNDWDTAACNSLEFKERDEGMSVGSFPVGAVNGVFDLSGNVWEWTSSKYSKYKGYKPIKVKIGRGEVVEGLASFDPTERVIVGGAYTVPDIGCRISIRQGEEKIQTTEALGFRCAADIQTGSVPAQWLLDTDIRVNVVGGIEFDPTRTAILQRWDTRPGTAKVDGYAVITGYQRTLFTPTKELQAGSPSDLTKMSTKEGPVVVGFLSFAHPLMEPEIDGGSYFVAWRGAAKVKELQNPDDPTNQQLKTGQDEETFPYWKVSGFNEELDCLFLYDLEGEPVVAWPAGEISFERLKRASTVRIERFVPPEEEPDEDAPPIIPMDTLRFSIAVEAKSRKGLHTDVILKIAPGTIDDSWK